MFGVTIDVSDRVELLERERRAREDAERAAKAAELFVAVLGHDLRNPLAAIEMGARNLVASGDPDLGRKGERMLRSSARMTRMIDQLLDFSRLRMGTGLELRRTETDLAAVVSHVVEELSGRVDAKRVSIHVRGDPRGSWDESCLAQVFSNLVGNALEHSDGDVSVEIDGETSDRAVVSVESRGQIAEDLLPVLFEPFRTSRSHAKSRGLGLGLYISREIARAHGGTIEVTSSANGTVFRVFLPRAAEPKT